jgi:hypothetical protein
MTEPSETGGLPLDLNTHQQQQPTATIILQPTSPRVNYRRTLQSSNDLPKGSKTTSPRRRPGTIQQTPSGPDPGSSRSEQQPALSPTNMSSHNSSIHYTRTGRISKAKKGLKVHNCANCGRVSHLFHTLISPGFRWPPWCVPKTRYRTSSQVDMLSPTTYILTRPALQVC